MESTPRSKRVSGAPRLPTPRSAEKSVETEHGLSSTIDIVPKGLAHISRDGGLQFVNAELAQLLGYSREELLALDFLDLVAPAERDACQALNAGVLGGVLPEYRRYTAFLRKDGSTVDLMLRIRPVLSRDGSVAHLDGVFERDETGRVTPAFAVEDRLRAALDASETGTYRWEVHTSDPEWDENLDRLFGLAAEPRLHTIDRLLTLIHPDDMVKVVESLWLSIGEGGEFEVDFRVVWPDGSPHWLHGRGRTVTDEAGNPLYITGACTDVTGRVRAEQAVRESEAKLRRIVDSGMIGVYYWAVDGTIVDANDEFLRMLGYSRDDLRAGLNVKRITPTEWGGIDAVKMTEVVEAGVAIPWEKEFIARDGCRVPVLVAEALLDGADRGGIAICLDVGERKRADLERERLLALEHDARAQAERAIRQREEVLAIVAHDLRDPVNTILMSATALLGITLDDSKRTRHLNIIQRAATGMDALIRDLLDFSRIEAGAFALRREPVDVHTLLCETVELFEEHARPGGVQLTSAIAPDVSTVIGDRDRLAQALSNLLSNAIKFSSPGGSVTIDARRTDDSLVISVTDTGPGIAPEDLPYIFDRYWQADRASRAGAGLGLLIAKGIVESHGGRIDVSSEVGRGTTIRCTLPIGESDEAGGAATT